MDSAPISKEKRLRIFFKRLGQKPVVSSFKAARRLLEDTLNEIEDEMSGVPFDPDAWRDDGRLYPPQDDNVSEIKGHPNVKRLSTRSHHVYISANGAMQIFEIDARTRVDRKRVFVKPGADGKGVWE